MGGTVPSFTSAGAAAVLCSSLQEEFFIFNIF
jgi:hypothetical protein